VRRFRRRTSPRSRKDFARLQTTLLALLALVLCLGCDGPTSATEPPRPPQLPRDFRWEGRWVVRDLDVDVPFRWQGRDGDVQMTAGSADDAIHFTNIIHDDRLYTLTYKWPGTVPPLPADDCVCLGRLTLDDLNLCLSSSRFVGAEILAGKEPRRVNHFRLSVVFGNADPTPSVLRAPIMQGDFYVDESDPSALWKVLHFGFQNVLDPALDEWAVLHELEATPGQVVLPAECAGACTGDDPVFPPGFFCK
jgi:hypothetical protein